MKKILILLAYIACAPTPCAASALCIASNSKPNTASISYNYCEENSEFPYNAEDTERWYEILPSKPKCPLGKKPILCQGYMHLAAVEFNKNIPNELIGLVVGYFHGIHSLRCFHSLRYF